MPLFTARVGDIVPPQSGHFLAYDLSPDSDRFLINTVHEEPAVPPITVVLNWKPAR